MCCKHDVHLFSAGTAHHAHEDLSLSIKAKHMSYVAAMTCSIFSCIWKRWQVRNRVRASLQLHAAVSHSFLPTRRVKPGQHQCSGYPNKH